MTLDEMRVLALRAAAAAGAVIREALEAGGGAEAVAETKGRGDYVTATDRMAQDAALAILGEGAPEVPVLAEESAGAGEGLPGGRCWVVDPLDGTTNFLRRFPVVGVSVALVEDGLPVVGVTTAPFLGAAWAGVRGAGARDAAGRPLRVRASGGRGVAATGFPFRRPHNLPRYLAVFDGAIRISEDLRRAGAATLDLAYSAQGSFDGFFELGLSPWDVAAGGLLVREAGGVVTDWDGDEAAWMRSGDILAGAPAWHERMLEICRSAAVAVEVGG